MKIIQISTATPTLIGPNGQLISKEPIVYGLGDDGVLYQYQPKKEDKVSEPISEKWVKLVTSNDI